MRSQGQSAGMLLAALKHVEAGRPVFVLGRTKRPVANCGACRDAGSGHDRAACECLTCHGFYAATTDPDRVRAMLAAVPYGLLAIRTGTVAGLVVVDIDPDHGGAVDPTLMPPTAAVWTGSGGWHLYYRHPGVSVTSRPMPGRVGVDIKADGGYVLVPPSRHPRTGRAYRTVGCRSISEMPPPLRSILTAPSTPPAPNSVALETSATVPATSPGAGGISSPRALLDSHLRAVAQAPKGKRRTTLYGTARGVARMIIAGAITQTDAIAELTQVGHAAEQTDRDIHAAIVDGFRAEGIAA